MVLDELAADKVEVQLLLRGLRGHDDLRHAAVGSLLGQYVGARVTRDHDHRRARVPLHNRRRLSVATVFFVSGFRGLASL